MASAQKVADAGLGSVRLVAPVADGKHEMGYASFELVFQGHYRRLVRSLALACGNQELAADLVQQAFVQLWASWPQVSRYESPANWVGRVAISRLQDHRRSIRRLAGALLRLEVQPEPAGGSPGDHLDITAALARLPLRQRLAIVLHYLDDRSIPDVASLMGVSEGTVNRHLFRAREALRSYLGDE